MYHNLINNVRINS